MQVLELRPVRVKALELCGATGLIDVVYEVRTGFLWRQTKTVTRRAMSTTGVMWKWVDSPSTCLHSITTMIDGNVPELANGQTIRVGAVPGSPVTT